MFQNDTVDGNLSLPMNTSHRWVKPSTYVAPQPCSETWARIDAVSELRFVDNSIQAAQRERGGSDKTKGRKQWEVYGPVSITSGLTVQTVTHVQNESIDNTEKSRQIFSRRRNIKIPICRILCAVKDYGDKVQYDSLTSNNSAYKKTMWVCVHGS